MVYYLANLGLHKASPRWCTLTTKPILKDADKPTPAVTRLLEEMVELKIAICATLILLAIVTLVATANDRPARSPSGLEVELNEGFLRDGYSPIHPRAEEDFGMDITVEIDEESTSAYHPTDYVRTARRPREYQARDYMGLPAFAPEDNFMSRAGKYRLAVKEATGVWITRDQAEADLRALYGFPTEHSSTQPRPSPQQPSTTSPRHGSQSSVRTASEPAPATPLTEVNSVAEISTVSPESVPESESGMAVMPSSPSSQPQIADDHRERKSNVETIQIFGIIGGCAAVGLLIWIGAVTTTSARETTRRNTLDEGRGAGTGSAVATAADGNRAFNVLDIGHMVGDETLTDVSVSGKGAAGESIAIRARRQPQGGGDPTLAAMQAMSQALQGPPVPAQPVNITVSPTFSPVFNGGAPVANAAPTPTPTPTAVRPTPSTAPAPRPEPVRVKVAPTAPRTPSVAPSVPQPEPDTDTGYSREVRAEAIEDLKKTLGDDLMFGLSCRKEAENVGRQDDWQRACDPIERYVVTKHEQVGRRYSTTRKGISLDEAVRRIQRALTTPPTPTPSPAPPAPAPAPTVEATPESPLDALKAIGGEPASSPVEATEPAVVLEESAPAPAPEPEPEAADGSTEEEGDTKED